MEPRGCATKPFLSRVSVCGDADVYKLRVDWRVPGSLVGALPLQPRQSGLLGLPLLLAPEEVSLLLDKG